MPFLCTATDGWRLPPPERPNSVALRSRLPAREPNGLRHAVELGAAKTLCGLSVGGLTVFAAIGFFTSQYDERCQQCDLVAARLGELLCDDR